MLTTIENIKELPGMANNIRDSRILPYLQEVEDATIVPAIGAELYEKLNSGEIEDCILLGGAYYTNRKGKREMCHGIRKAVAYLAYSKMLMANKVSVTAFGVTEKTSQYSQSANAENVNYAANHAEKMGHFYLNSCLCYLADKNPEPCSCSAGHSRHYITMQVID